MSIATEAVGRYVYGDCDDATIAWAAKRMRPQRAATLTEAPATEAWRAKPSTYVVCAHDRAGHADLQRVLAKRCSITVEWDASHSPFASMPRKTAEFLIEFSR